MKYIAVIDIPTPWRDPVFDRVYDHLGDSFNVVYFKNNEKRRLWNFPPGRHPKTILPCLTLTTGDSERFFNPGLVPFLLRHRPQVAVVSACIKDPSGWLAMATCKLMGINVALLDDSWLGRDRRVNAVQRLARKVVYNCFGDAFVGASRQTLAMFKHYNRHVNDEQCFLSHLVADNDYFRARLSGKQVERRFDVMFSGRIALEKNPAFFAGVCGGIKQRLGKCRALVIGDGREDLKAAMRSIFEQHGVTYEFAGFIQHDALPDYYAQAKLLLLPTSGDCWGVVINEAMVTGTPVVTTEMTAAAGELVRHEENGLVLPLDAVLWADKIASLLQCPERLDRFGHCAREAVAKFSFENAAQGILSALRYCEQRKCTSRRRDPTEKLSSEIGISDLPKHSKSEP